VRKALRFPSVIGALLVIGLVACKGVRATDLTGTWVIKDESRANLPPEFRRALAKLVVSADGTFAASELPQPMHPSRRHHVTPQMRLTSGDGVWKLRSSNGGQELQLEFQYLVSLAGKRRTSSGFIFAVSRGWSAPSLYYDLDDPDEAIRAVFVRQ